MQNYPHIQTASAEPLVEPPECYVLLKNGMEIRLNLSTSRVKMLKKSGASIPAVAPDGAKVLIPARGIKRISSNKIV